MTGLTRIPAIAGEPLDGGTFVALTGDDAFADPTLERRGGVVVGPGHYEAKQPIIVQTDGGILAVITAGATLTIRGRQVRFVAGEKYYLHLSGGWIAGFEGHSRCEL